MNEEFVPYELAKKLKEKGFRCAYPIAILFAKKQPRCNVRFSMKGGAE